MSNPASKSHKETAHTNRDLRENTLQRREAVLIARKICRCLPDPSAVSSVSLRPKHRNTIYELCIKMAADKASRDRIESVTRKNGLKFEEYDGIITVSSV